MNFLNKLRSSTKHQFGAVSAALLVMFAFLLSPLLPARLYGTPVQLQYQVGYIESEMTIYPSLVLQSIPKDQLPCLLNSIFFYSETEQEAVQQLNEIETFYLVVEPVDGLLQVTNVLTSRPTSGLYLIADYAYFEYQRMPMESSTVWQDNYQGIGMGMDAGLSIYVPRSMPSSQRQAILDGTAVMDAVLYRGQLYFIDFNL